MTARLKVLAEGQTEEAFVREVLAPHLQEREVYAIATCVCTRRVQRRRAFRGGVVRYDHVRKDLRELLRDRDVKAVTTMLDLYHLPADFPGTEDLGQSGLQTPAERIDHLEACLANEIGDPRLIPYIVQHEFEALLFASPEAIAQVFPAPETEAEIRAIAGAFPTPEDIDDGPETAPSKRLQALFPRYQKPLHGVRIAQAAGLAAIRDRCPRFDAWLGRLEALGETPPAAA